MTWGQLLFQDAASPIILQLISFHDHTLIILTLVISVVTYAIYVVIRNKYTNRYLIEAQQIETIW
jgi:cytochrome c oxidase subunit 2